MEKKLSTAITKVQVQPSQKDAKMATQVLLMRSTHKKHKTNPITPITHQKNTLKAQTSSHSSI